MADKPELLTGERQQREHYKAILACNDYLRLGPGRSLAKLHRFYINSASENPPTRHLRTLAEWSRRFGWQERARAYDAAIEREKNAYVRSIMQSGLALAHKRVLKLVHLADTLAAEIWDEEGNFIGDAVWLPDVKQIGRGDEAERVDIVRFNRSILREFRAVLDDLAKETGGRRQRLELGGEDGEPIKITIIEAVRPR